MLDQDIPLINNSMLYDILTLVHTVFKVERNTIKRHIWYICWKLLSTSFSGNHALTVDRWTMRHLVDGRRTHSSYRWHGRRMLRLLNWRRRIISGDRRCDHGSIGNLGRVPSGRLTICIHKNTKITRNGIVGF